MGTYDKTIRHCSVRKQDTEHQMGWEAEEPKKFDPECIVCGPHVILGPGLFDKNIIKPGQVHTPVS